MSEKDQLCNDFIELEVQRIKLLFEKNKYNTEQKKWFIEAKLMNKEKENNEAYIEIYERLLEEINNEKMT